MTSLWLPESVFQTGKGMGGYSAGRARAQALDSTYDLSTADGAITACNRVSRQLLTATVCVANVHRNFSGWGVGPSAVQFVLKSSLTQLGVDAHNAKIQRMDKDSQTIVVDVDLVAINTLAILALDYLTVGAKIGRLFAAVQKRCIRTMEYVDRLLGSLDMHGLPLLVHGTSPSDPKWEMKLVNGRVVAFLPVRPGIITYSGEIHGLLPTVGAALQQGTNYKELLRLHQQLREGHTRIAKPGHVLMVRSYPMHLRTMFGRVVADLLPAGLRCMSSTIIEPESDLKDRKDASHGRTFVFYGDSSEELTAIPVEFFSLECYREHVNFQTRVTLAARCSDVNTIAKAFDSIPPGPLQAATYVCKGSTFDELRVTDWVSSDPVKEAYVGNKDPIRQQALAEQYMFQQCEYPILSAISVGDITSDGVLLTRYFPSPILKPLLLSSHVHKRLRAIYFVQASRQHGSFLSQEDAAMLGDLHTFGISVFQVDLRANSMYQFMKKIGSDSGMMVPLARRTEYLESTAFGVYGSNLVAGNFEAELRLLLSGILELRKACKHPLLNAEKPLCLVTGGGPGAMEVGNRVAQSLGILSCGLFVDFGSLASKPGATINEQKKNPFVEAYMTYRPTKLVERQSDFNLDFPIFLTGGVGTDFEFALEEVRRKVGTARIHPMILFGTAEHWGSKISGRFQENLRSGTIKGSEWLSTVPWVVEGGKQALAVFRRFFNGTLPMGPGHPVNDRGFMVADEAFMMSDEM
jgi:predicted Rossmann-fold nucleotide-binding protein